MAKQIAQLRFTGSASDSDITFEEGESWSNNLLGGKYVVHLGIYALPGTRFLINQDNVINGEDLVINSSGIFQIDVEDRPITSLRLDKNSYDNANGHGIIIDIIYIKEVSYSE